MLKVVAQAIQMYTIMQVFKLPQSIILELEKMCRAFFGGQRKMKGEFCGCHGKTYADQKVKGEWV